MPILSIPHPGLSYRLGMLHANHLTFFALDACPEKCENIFLEMGELSRNRNAQLLKLPTSKTFLNIVEARKKENRDVYLEFMGKMKEKQKNYEKKIFSTTQKDRKVCYVSKKTGQIIYLEKHRTVPGHENGKYEKENTLLLTFPEHVMAHHLRFLQYQKYEDQTAVLLMLSNSNVDTRHLRASLAGSIGGKKQQQLLQEQNLGWFNSEVQSKLGRKGAAKARSLNVGAFDPLNKEKADIAWKDKYETDEEFQQKMKNNLQKGLETQRNTGKNIYNSISQRIRSVNYRGILVNNKRMSTPYSSYSLESGKFEYTEARVHVSEDFFWYHIYFSNR